MMAGSRGISAKIKTSPPPPPYYSIAHPKKYALRVTTTIFMELNVSQRFPDGQNENLRNFILAGPAVSYELAGAG